MRLAPAVRPWTTAFSVCLERSSFACLLVAIAGALLLGACSGEIVIANERGRSMESAQLGVFTPAGPTGRVLEVSADSPATLAAGEMIYHGGKGYVAGEAGGTVEIRDGELVLRGMKEVK